MKKNSLLYFQIGSIGSLLCFVCDALLGGFVATEYFNRFRLFPRFPVSWADASLMRFTTAALCGILSVPLLFLGFYAFYGIMKERKIKYKKIYLGSVMLFCAGDVLYNSLFAMTAYLYSYLTKRGYSGAAQASWNMFVSFIPLSFFAVVGFVLVSLFLFHLIWSGVIGFPRWAVACNSLVFMLIFHVLSAIFPHTALTNVLFSWGKQSLGLFIMFTVYGVIYCRQMEQNERLPQPVSVNLPTDNQQK